MWVRVLVDILAKLGLFAWGVEEIWKMFRKPRYPVAGGGSASVPGLEEALGPSPTPPDPTVVLRSGVWAWKASALGGARYQIRLYDASDPDVYMTSRHNGELGEITQEVLEGIAGKAKRRTWRRFTGGIGSIAHYRHRPTVRALSVDLGDGHPPRERLLIGELPQRFPWEGLGWATAEELEEWAVTEFGVAA